MADKFFTKFSEVVSGETAAASPAVAALAPVAALANVVAAPQPAHQPAPQSSPGASFPWPWAIALGLAIIAGFLLGRSSAADWWVIAIVLLTLVAAGAGFDAGRRSGGKQ
jgi:hypothetical protein